MSAEAVLSIARAVLDGLIQLVSALGGNPKETIVQLMDEHPLVQQADASADAAINDKFPSNL